MSFTTRFSHVSNSMWIYECKWKNNNHNSSNRILKKEKNGAPTEMLDAFLTENTHFTVSSISWHIDNNHFNAIVCFTFFCQLMSFYKAKLFGHLGISLLIPTFLSHLNILNTDGCVVWGFKRNWNAAGGLIKKPFFPNQQLQLSFSSPSHFLKRKEDLCGKRICWRRLYKVSTRQRRQSELRQSTWFSRQFLNLFTLPKIVPITLFLIVINKYLRMCQLKIFINICWNNLNAIIVTLIQIHSLIKWFDRLIHFSVQFVFFAHIEQTNECYC